MIRLTLKEGEFRYFNLDHLVEARYSPKAKDDGAEIETDLSRHLPRLELGFAVPMYGHESADAGDTSLYVVKLYGKEAAAMKMQLDNLWEMTP